MSLSEKTRSVVCLATVLAFWIVGWGGMVIPLVVVYFTTQSRLDVDTLLWFRSVSRRYNVELEEDVEDFPKDTPPVINGRTAVRFALIAQGRVGMLSPTGANRLVYETVLLKIFDEYHVRHNIRVRLLGEALVACFIRPDEYQRALSVIDVLGEGGPPGGVL